MNKLKLVDLARRFSSEEPERKDRIQGQIVQDANGDEDVTYSWYYYLEGKLDFPFWAMVQTHRKRYSKNSVSDCASRIHVLGLAPLQRCGPQQIWAMGILATSGTGTPVHILLTDLVSVDADEKRQEALGDWMYWNRDHDFGIWELK